MQYRRQHTRIASVLLFLFAIGHTLGFRKIDPNWRLDALISLMRSIRFDAQGFSRTYWVENPTKNRK